MSRSMLYVLKAPAISAALFGYYWLFLRDRSFHRWNRGFLLATVVFSVVLPLVPLPDLFALPGFWGLRGLLAWAGEPQGWAGVLHAVVEARWAEGEGLGPGAGMVATASGTDWGSLACWGYALFRAGFTGYRVSRLPLSSIWGMAARRNPVTALRSE